MANLGAASRWSFVASWSRQGLSALFAFGLAAMLGPESYGVVAIALVVISILQVLADQGLVVALVQRKELDTDHLHASFWMVTGVCLILTACAVLFAGIWAQMNGSALVGDVMLALSPLVMIKGLGVVPLALLLRKLDFRREAVITFWSLLAGGVAGVSLAFVGAGVWSLVAMQLVQESVYCLGLWISGRYRPAPRVSAGHVKELWPISAGAFVESFGHIARTRADALIIGLTFGPLAVGLYRLADRVVELVLGLTLAPIFRVTLPYMSRHQSNHRRFRMRVRHAVRLSTGLTIPTLGLVAGVSAALMQTLGRDWVPAAPAVSILCLNGMAMSAMQFAPHLLNALGRPLLGATITWCAAVMSALSFVAVAFAFRSASTETQVIAMAAARVATMYLVYLPLACWQLYRAAKITLADVVLPGARPLVSAAVGYLVARSLYTVGCCTSYAAADLIVVSALSTLAVLASVWVVDRSYVRIYVWPSVRQITARVSHSYTRMR